MYVSPFVYQMTFFLYWNICIPDGGASVDMGYDLKSLRDEVIERYVNRFRDEVEPSCPLRLVVNRDELTSGRDAVLIIKTKWPPFHRLL